MLVNPSGAACQPCRKTAPAPPPIVAAGLANRDDCDGIPDPPCSVPPSLTVAPPRPPVAAPHSPAPADARLRLRRLPDQRAPASRALAENGERQLGCMHGRSSEISKYTYLPSLLGWSAASVTCSPTRRHTGATRSTPTSEGLNRRAGIRAVYLLDTTAGSWPPRLERPDPLPRRGTVVRAYWRDTG